MDEPLLVAHRIGFLGDTHGDMQHVLEVSKAMERYGVTVMCVLGDFGFVWPSRGWVADLDRLNRRLELRGQTLYWVDGNHEAFDLLYDRFPVGDDGLRRVRSHIIHLPRGYRATLASGKTLAVLGGATSIDANRRIEGLSWWREEAITHADLDTLGRRHADVMIGHDAPLNVPPLDRLLQRIQHEWPRPMVKYARAGRAAFHQGFLQVQPELYLGGHYHVFIDEVINYPEPQPFRCRVVLLAENGYRPLSQAVLDVHTLELEAFSRQMHAQWGEDNQLADQLRWLRDAIGTDVVAVIAGTSYSQVRHWAKGFSRIPDEIAPHVRLAREVTEALLATRTAAEAREWWQFAQASLADRSPAQAVRDMGPIIVGALLHELAKG